MRPSITTVAGLLALQSLAINAARGQDFGGGPVAERYFSLEWATAETRSGRPVVTGSLTNRYGYSAANIQLLVEQLDAAGQPIAKTLGYINGDVPAGARAYFQVSVPAAGATYRVTVQSYDWIMGKN